MIKQTHGALNFLIADYKGVLKNALIASSATFFSLTANATDTTIDLTASTPQTDIIVNVGDTVTLNNGKTAFPEDAPYTASNLIKASVNAQYRFDIGSVSLIPHAGVHYNNIHVDGYNVSADSKPVASIGSSTADIVSIPVGLSVEKSFNLSDDWKLKPAANVSVAFNTGVTDTRFTSTFIGMAGDNLKAEIADDFTYGAGVGLSLTRKNTTSIDAGVSYVGSQNTNSYDVFLRGSYIF